MEKIRVGDYLNLLSEIKTMSLFQYLTETEQQQLLDVCEILAYSKDEKIIKQGETGTSLYAVLSGTMNVSVTDNNGKEIFLNNIYKGGFFGEAGIFWNAKRTAHVYPATDNAGLLCIERKELFEFIKKYPTAGVKILMLFIKSLLGKISESNKELATARGSTVMEQNQIDDLIDQILGKMKGA